MKGAHFARRFLLPLMLFALLTLPVRAAGCDHQYEPRRREPTCTTDGMSWMECVRCGDTKDYVSLDSVGHAFGQWYVLEYPTCTREGIQASECSVCGHHQTAPVPPLGHSYTPEIRHPTCGASGYTRYTCSYCTSYYISDYTKPLGHGYDNGVLIKEPTDTALGRVRFTCIRCSETYQVTYAFRDIDCNAYYFTPVIWAVNSGVTSGLDETHFGPDVFCSRAQVATFLWRAAGKPEPKLSVNPFLDVKAGSFYEKPVLWAYENGITTGTDATHFSPDAICNRAQVVTFLHRTRGCPEPVGTISFPDVPAGSFYHKAVLWAAEREITLGMDGGYFRPALSCTRAQIVTFLYRDTKNP